MDTPVTKSLEQFWFGNIYAKLIPVKFSVIPVMVIMPSILLIDEHGVYRKGIRALIEDADLARVVEGVELRGELGDFFDLLLIDFNSLDQLRLQEARARTLACAWQLCPHPMLEAMC
ncbi:hypothetical protein ACFIOY_29535 [Bradyrhizobium sp. TZ2]